MSQRNAEKIKQRKENLKANKPPTFSSAPNKIWFSLVFIALVSAICYLAYQAYANNLMSELIIPIVILVILLSALIIWGFPKFYVQSLPNEAGKTFDRENAKLKLEDDTRKTFAQIVGGAVLLGGLVFTFNTFRLQQDTYRLQQEGQFTDRFTKAVTQIGDDKLEVRLGGLYALERIAKDSPKDHWTVMEIVSAYVREKAPRQYENVKNNEANGSMHTNTKTDETTETKNKVQTFATDVQTALTIIGRRNSEQDSKIDVINLSNTNLIQAHLSRANLRNTYLNYTILSYSDLTYVDLTKSDLLGAKLFLVNLSGAKLSGADLTQADLSRAELSGTDLTYADLSRAKLNLADLFLADLRGAKLSSTYDLTFEQLSNAIINENTTLPPDLESQKANLLEISKKNEETKKNIILANESYNRTN